MHYHLSGLIPATFTPLNADGSLNLGLIEPMVDFLIGQKLTGLYVCGSTGEGVSLSTAERKTVAAAFVKATRGRVPVILQVGHTSLVEAQELADHAQEIGADAISAVPPSTSNRRRWTPTCAVWPRLPGPRRTCPSTTITSPR